MRPELVALPDVGAEVPARVEPEPMEQEPVPPVLVLEPVDAPVRGRRRRRLNIDEMTQLPPDIFRRQINDYRSTMRPVIILNTVHPSKYLIK